MKHPRLLRIAVACAVAAATLGGCVVLPPGGYGYGYRHHGDYRDYGPPPVPPGPGWGR